MVLLGPSNIPSGRGHVPLGITIISLYERGDRRRFQWKVVETAHVMLGSRGFSYTQERRNELKTKHVK